MKLSDELFVDAVKRYFRLRMERGVNMNRDVYNGL